MQILKCEINRKPVMIVVRDVYEILKKRNRKSVNVLVRLLGSLKSVAISSSLEPLCIKGSFFVLKKTE